MITIRAEVPADEPAIHNVEAQAFGRELEAVLADRLRTDGDLLLSLVAVDDGDLVGHVAFSRAWIDHGSTRFAAVVLGPVAVRPDRQRQGIGGRLIEEGHRRLIAAGETLCVLVGHPSYYPRFGYRPERAAGFTAPYHGEAFMACAFGDAPTDGTFHFAKAFQQADG